jgi:hypothetical protein
MDIVAETSTAKNTNAYEPLSRAHSGRVLLRAGIENLNVEISTRTRSFRLTANGPFV